MVALSLAATACGSDDATEKTFNTTKLEGRILEEIERQAGVDMKAVVCPDEVVLKAKDTFTCTATTANGQSATVKATQTSDDGKVRYEVGR